MFLRAGFLSKSNSRLIIIAHTAGLNKNFSDMMRGFYLSFSPVSVFLVAAERCLGASSFWILLSGRITGQRR